jgi:hypothetical protein
LAGAAVASISSSWSLSSARVFLLADVVLAVVAVELLAVLAAAFALAAAVTILVVLVVVSTAFAAARERVIRFGGEWGSILGRIDGNA